jgi:pimeloyl-ACP methyl ester carboxylesterase
VQELLEETPLTVTAAYYATLIEHDEVASLEVLRRVPVTVLVGDADRLTPVSHSRLMAEALGDAAELVVVPGAGTASTSPAARSSTPRSCGCSTGCSRTAADA